MNKYGIDTHEYWLKTIETEVDLTDWEKNFIGDMRIRVNNKWPLTDSQEAKLEQIYVTKTS
jgi:hypothetical protein